MFERLISSEASRLPRLLQSCAAFYESYQIFVDCQGKLVGSLESYSSCSYSIVICYFSIIVLLYNFLLSYFYGNILYVIYCM